MKIFFILLFLFFSSIANAGIVICHDQNGKVNNFQLGGEEILGCLYLDAGQNITALEAENTKLLLKTVHRKYLLVDNGQLREMTLQEKTQADIEEQQALEQQQRNDIDQVIVSNEEVVRALVQVINIRLPTGQKITKEEVIQQIKTNRGL